MIIWRKNGQFQNVRVEYGFRAVWEEWHVDVQLYKSICTNVTLDKNIQNPIEFQKQQDS